jgi:NADH-quinone oxidoreductase subunit F
LLQIAGKQPRRIEMAPFDDKALATLSATVHSGSADVSRYAGLLPSEFGRTGFSLPQGEYSRDTLRLLRRVGVVEPESLDSYLSLDGYQSLSRALELGRAGVIAELMEAKLLGRGGAAFPTGVKWQAVANNSKQPHYFVCNADESEPGTFKDRVLIEHDPFAIIEALTIAGYATGSERGYIYVRGEYPSGERRLIDAAYHARGSGYLGSDVLGAGFQFDIEIRRGAGAYIAGEETALFNSIEGKRPEPRNKPPFPTQAGLFGKPTGVNNAETLLNVLEIMRVGGTEFARQGTSESTGTRLFCLSGAIARPGLYEAPFGITLRELLSLAGGVRRGHDIRAILLGGAAGSFLGPDDLGIELSFEGARSAGASLGSGVVMVFDETADFGVIVKRVARFFRDESCGQCVPCRIGTVRQEELVARLVDGQLLGTTDDELALLADLSSVMRDASICGLGQTATSAVESAIRLGLVSVPEHGS